MVANLGPTGKAFGTEVKIGAISTTDLRQTFNSYIFRIDAELLSLPSSR